MTNTGIPDEFPIRYYPIDHSKSDYFIAIDSGTLNICFAVFKVNRENHSFSIVEIIYLNRELHDLSELQKMMHIQRYAWRLFLKYSPFVIVFELLALNNVPKYKLAGVLAAQNVTGQLILTSGMQNIPYVALPPTQIKYTVTGFSKSSKKRVQTAVDNLMQHSIPLVLRVNHVADAIAIGYTYLKTRFNK